MLAYWVNSKRVTILPAALALAVLLVASRAHGADPQANQNQVEKPAASWVAIPGGIADFEGKFAYVASYNDGFEVVDMAKGKPVWETKTAYRPLALVDDRLIVKGPRGEAAPNTLHVLVLNAADGKVRLECPAIVFPEWISVDGGLGLAFSSRAEIQDDTFLLHWHASRHHAGTEKATPEMIAAARKEASGVVQVDLATGQSEIQVDDIPQPFKQERAAKFIDVGNKRLSMTETAESIPGGIHHIRRTLFASDRATGRPLWQREIISEVFLPVPTAAKRNPAGAPSTNRRR